MSSISKGIVIYGAGKRGKHWAEMLYAHNVEIVAFCDSYKNGSVLIDNMEQKPIWRLEDIDRDKYAIVIAIVDQDEKANIYKKIHDFGIQIVTIDEVFNLSNIVQGERELVAEVHEKFMDDYYENGENNIEFFWSHDSVFYQLFQKMNIDDVVELACGWGRHVPQYLKDAKHIILVDILERNIEYCKDRFKDEKKITYYANSGHDLNLIESETQTAVFSYDAMVHFELLDIFEYLKEINRILVQGGRALIQHSNNTEDYKVTFLTGKGGKNYMSAQLFAHLSNRAGLTVIEQHIINGGLDCLTLLEK